MSALSPKIRGLPFSRYESGIAASPFAMKSRRSVVISFGWVVCTKKVRRTLSCIFLKSDPIPWTYSGRSISESSTVTHSYFSRGLKIKKLSLDASITKCPVYHCTRHSSMNISRSGIVSTASPILSLRLIMIVLISFSDTFEWWWTYERSLPVNNPILRKSWRVRSLRVSLVCDTDMTVWMSL